MPSQVLPGMRRSILVFIAARTSPPEKRTMLPCASRHHRSWGLNRKGKAEEQATADQMSTLGAARRQGAERGWEEGETCGVQAHRAVHGSVPTLAARPHGRTGEVVEQSGWFPRVKGGDRNAQNASAALVRVEKGEVTQQLAQAPHEEIMVLHSSDSIV